jgi:hypothetical protein
MPKSLDEIERFLTGHGYPCRRLDGMHLATHLPTSSYRNGAGCRSIEVHISLEPEAGCLVIDAPHAFELGQSQYKEATLACLNAASAHTPLVKAHLDPTQGDVRFRVDCLLLGDDRDQEGLLRALVLIPKAADRWHPQIVSAMEKGRFDQGVPPTAPCDAQLLSLARRAGGVNRLAALVRMNQAKRADPDPGASVDPSSN